MASSPSVPGRPIEVFFSYAHRDETLRDELANHLSLLQNQKVIVGWYDRQIPAGTEWAGAIDAHLENAQIILLLISADFMASTYCYGIEMQRAMERHEAGEARVVPIILRPVDWHNAPFGKLQALPEDGRAVTLWTNQDEAFFDIARGIRSIAEELLGNPPSILPWPPPPVPPSDGLILALEKLIGCIRAYFDDLLSGVSGPKRFIAERLSRDELAMQKALVFLVVSFFISWGLQTPWIQSNPLLELISDSVFVLTYVMAYGGALYLAWYIAGGRSERQKFLTIHFYYSGVLKLMMTSVYLGTMGTLRAADPALFKEICNAAHSGSIIQFLSTNSPRLLANPGFLLCLGVLYVGCGAMLIWIFAGWGAYRELNQLSKRRSIMAGLLFFAFCFPVAVVTSVIANSLVRQTAPC